jgi:hypothetical protein
MTRSPRLRTAPAALVAALLLLLLAPPALAHEERPVTSPARPGSVPDLNRIAHQHPVLDVCKTKVGGHWECKFRDIQAAVNAAPNGALIRIWPGLYKEIPSRRAKGDYPPDNPDGTTYSYEFQKKHPNAINLVGIIGKKNITLLGMGRRPLDVVVDGGFAKHVGIRADRSDGYIISNLSFFHAVEHGIYVMDSSGFVFDHVESGWSGEYSLFSFATDHGLWQHCEAYGTGDAALYAGASADVPGRFSTEIRDCIGRHSALGYSGTQGDHVWVHDSKFYDNALGFATDSETDHPNYPQNNLTLERNQFFDNNFNPYAADSDVFVEPIEAAFDAFAQTGGGATPVGVGLWILAGNDNLVQDNQFWGNERFGAWLSTGQGLLVGPASDPPAPPFLSSGNRFISNRMYPPIGAAGKPNGVDFGWDGGGLDNCWQDNAGSPSGGSATSEGPVPLPPCQAVPGILEAPPPVWIPNLLDIVTQLGQVIVGTQPICAYNAIDPCAWGPGPKPENARNTAEGERVEWPPPPTCGPSTCKKVLAKRYD